MAEFSSRSHRQKASRPQQRMTLSHGVPTKARRMTLMLMIALVLFATTTIEALRVVELFVAPQLLPSASPFVCDDGIAVATEAAAEDCMADHPCPSMMDAAAIGFTFSECSVDSATGNEVVHLRGGIIQVGVNTSFAAETDACIQTTLDTLCLLHFLRAIPNLSSLTVSPAVLSDDETDDFGEEEDITPPPVKLPSTIPVAPTGIPKVSVPRTLSPAVSMAPTAAPTLVLVTNRPTTLVPMALVIPAPTVPPTGSSTTEFPSVADTTDSNDETTEAPTLAPISVATPATVAPQGAVGNTPPTLAPNAGEDETPFPTAAQPASPTALAPSLTVPSGSNNITNAAPVNGVTPIVSNGNGAASNRDVIGPGDSDGDNGNSTLYKGIVSGFAGVAGMAFLTYAAILLRRRRRQKGEGQEDGRYPSSDSRPYRHDGKKVATLGASAVVVVDTTHNTLSEHADNDFYDSLERGSGDGDSGSGGGGGGRRGRPVAISPSPTDTKARRFQRGGYAAAKAKAAAAAAATAGANDVQSRRSGSASGYNNPSTTTSSVDAASAILDHFGAAADATGGGSSSSANRDVATTTAASARSNSAAGSVPEHDELSSTCSSFDLNDSDGEESSMYESVGEDNETLTLDEEGDFEPIFDATAVTTSNYQRHRRRTSKAASEVSSLSSAQFETGDTGTASGQSREEEAAIAAAASTTSSRQFVEWLHKSPLIPAAAKASRSAGISTATASSDPARQKPPATVALPNNATSSGSQGSTTSPKFRRGEGSPKSSQRS